MQNVGNRLSRPVDKDEMEFAAGIVGRFAIRSGNITHNFTAYGTSGLSLLHDDYIKLLRLKQMAKRESKILEKIPKYQEFLELAELRAIFLLRKAFPGYFVSN